jgi:hypothetical protein
MTRDKLIINHASRAKKRNCARAATLLVRHDGKEVKNIATHYAHRSQRPGIAARD